MDFDPYTVICVIVAVVWLADWIVDVLWPSDPAQYHNTPDNQFTHGQKIGPITPRSPGKEDE